MWPQKQPGTKSSQLHTTFLLQPKNNTSFGSGTKKNSAKNVTCRALEGNRTLIIRLEVWGIDHYTTNAQKMFIFENWMKRAWFGYQLIRQVEYLVSTLQIWAFCCQNSLFYCFEWSHRESNSTQSPCKGNSPPWYMWPQEPNHTRVVVKDVSFTRHIFVCVWLVCVWPRNRYDSLFVVRLLIDNKLYMRVAESHSISTPRVWHFSTIANMMFTGATWSTVLALEEYINRLQVHLRTVRSSLFLKLCPSSCVAKGASHSLVRSAGVHSSLYLLLVAPLHTMTRSCHVLCVVQGSIPAISLSPILSQSPLCKNRTCKPPSLLVRLEPVYRV